MHRRLLAHHRAAASRAASSFTTMLLLHFAGALPVPRIVLGKRLGMGIFVGVVAVKDVIRLRRREHEGRASAKRNHKNYDKLFRRGHWSELMRVEWPSEKVVSTRSDGGRTGKQKDK